MTRPPPHSAHAIRLPRGLVQPFDLRFSADDLHVIAYFENHPVYEAVEAMIRIEPGSRCRVRAILTRRDQTQVDHVDDCREGTGVQHGNGRVAVPRDVLVERTGAPHKPRIVVCFESFANEQVQFCLQATGPADPARGGLTDPGGHAARSSLPLMWRARSCLAGQGTSVTIDGVGYKVRERVRHPGFVGLDGFYTEGHEMGLVRAGRRKLVVLEEPTRIDLKSVWRYADGDGRPICWTVTQWSSSGQAVIETTQETGRERVHAQIHGGALQLLEVRRAEAIADERGLALRFLPQGRFAMDVSDQKALVTGTVHTSEHADGECRFSLLPDHPRWAAARSLEASMARTGDEVEITTAVG